MAGKGLSLNMGRDADHVLLLCGRLARKHDDRGGALTDTQYCHLHPGNTWVNPPSRGWRSFRMLTTKGWKFALGHL